MEGIILKSLIKLFLIGIVVAIIGIIFSDAFSVFVNGLDRNTSRILGMGTYICIVLVVCTGVIVKQVKNN